MARQSRFGHPGGSVQSGHQWAAIALAATAGTGQAAGSTVARRVASGRDAS